MLDSDADVFADQVRVLRMENSKREAAGNRLWLAYLALIVWVFLPLYASPLAFLLPLAVSDISALIAVAIAALGPVAWYVADRGGPVSFTAPEVLYGLRGRADRKILARNALSQAVPVCALGLMSTAVLYVMTATIAPIEPEMYALVSLAGALAGAAGFSMSLAWSGLPALFRIVSAAAAGFIGLNALGSAISWYSLLGVSTLTLASIGGWWWRIDRFSLAFAWRRAESLADVRAALALADPRSAILSLRRTVDGPRIDRKSVSIARPSSALWRPIRSLSTMPSRALWRLGLSTAGCSILLTIMPSSEASLVAAGFVLLTMALDTTASVGAFCSSMTLVRSAERNFRSALVFELLVGSTVLIGLAALAWLPSIGSGGVGLVPWLLLALASGLAAGLQARIGQPDLAHLLNSVGPESLGLVLVVRGLLFVIAWFLAVAAAAASTTIQPFVWLVVWIAVIGGTFISAVGLNDKARQ